MALPKLVPLDHIEKLEHNEHEAFVSMLNNYEEQKEVSDSTKEQWLAIYARCLSPSVACKQLDISVDTYRKWRSNDPRFCRSLNACIEQAQEELVGSVLTRATGYTRADEETDSGHVEDSSGKVLRFGASDTLAKAVLGLDKPEQNRGEGTALKVVIDVGALLGKTSSAIDMGDTKPEPRIIEHEPGPRATGLGEGDYDD